MKVLIAGKAMKTRSQYTELLYSLSPSTNVTESLKAFGFSDTNGCALALRFNCEDGEGFARELQEKLKCSVLDFDISHFERFSDAELVRKTYKLSTSAASLEICSIISSKGI
jgi:EKC/KEOPS complex subunit CGI121/TPRKB